MQTATIYIHFRRKENGLYCAGFVMMMSWKNPTPAEANEQYYYNRNKYNDALAQRRASERKETQYREQKNAAKAQMSTLSTKKVNFENRIKGLEKIIQALVGAGWMSVPAAIDKVAKQLQKVDSSYKGSIKVSGTVPMADIGNAFFVKSVESEPHSASALQQFRAEKARLEREKNPTTEDLLREIRDLLNKE